jgi:hypothetical protein
MGLNSILHDGKAVLRLCNRLGQITSPVGFVVELAGIERIL